MCEAVLVVFWGIVAGVLGGFSACGVCSRLLEMADVRSAEADASALQKCIQSIPQAASPPVAD